jgi:hypothetical protein
MYEPEPEAKAGYSIPVARPRRSLVVPKVKTKLELFRVRTGEIREHTI